MLVSRFFSFPYNTFLFYETKKNQKNVLAFVSASNLEILLSVQGKKLGLLPTIWKGQLPENKRRKKDSVSEETFD